MGRVPFVPKPSNGSSVRRRWFGWLCVGDMVAGAGGAVYALHRILNFQSTLAHVAFPKVQSGGRSSDDGSISHSSVWRFPTIFFFLFI